MSDEQRQHGTRSAGLVAVPAAVGALVLGAMILSGSEGPARSVLAVLLVLGGGVGLGPLLLLTPVEPSPLKLWLFSALLGLPLVAGTFAVASGALGLGPDVAWSLPFALSGLAAAAASRRRVGVAPPGRAALAALLLGGLASLGGWALLASSGGAQAWLAQPAAVVHLTLADLAVHGVETPNPWFLGGALDLRPAVGVALAGVAAPAALSVGRVLPLIGGWSLLVITVAGYLASAAAFREQRMERAGGRDLLAAALGLVALGLGPIGLAVQRGALSAQPALELDPAATLARTYAAAALLAGLHAVRRGARPWPGLAAVMAGSAALAQPWVGLSLMVAIGAPALRARRAFLIPLLLGAGLPAFWVGRRFGGFALDQVTSVGPPGALSLVGIYVLFIPALLVGRGWVRDARVTGPGLDLLLLAVLAPLALAGVAGPAAWDGAALVGVALFPLALLAARGLAVLGTKGLAAGALLALVGAAGLVGPGGFVVVGGEGPSASPFREGDRGLELIMDPDLSAGLGEAFREARRVASEVDGRVALLRGGIPRPSALPTPSLAPLLTGASLWVGEAAPPGAIQPRLGAARSEASGETALGDQWVDRRTLRDALFRDRNAWHPRFDRVLKAEVERGTTLLFVVTEQDRRQTSDRGVGPRGVDAILLRLGAARIFEAPEAALYRLDRGAE